MVTSPKVYKGYDLLGLLYLDFWKAPFIAVDLNDYFINHYPKAPI